jgi:hypothetical protein
MRDALLACVGTGLLLGSAALSAACLRLRSAIAYLLAVYLAANVLVVATALALSPWHALERRTLLAVLAMVLGLCLAGWWLSGNPAPPWRAALATARLCVRDRVVGPLAGIVATGFAYVVALAVLTPESEWDALTYHLARAAFWKQQQAVAYIPNAIETRLNSNPPNAEIADLFTMLVSGSDRYVGLVQVGALLACMLGAIGIARRIGLSPRESAFGGLLLFTLPVVTTQAWTAQNDLTVASFLVIAVYFAVERTGAELVLAGIAMGLALGTKFTAVLSLPLVAAVVLASPRPGRLKALATVLLISAFGGYWYVVNLRETGAADGGLAGAQLASHSPGAVATTAYRFVLGMLELSGAPTAAWLWYVIAGVIVALLGALRRREHDRLTPALLAAIVILAAPVLVALAARSLWRLYGEGSIAGQPTFSAGATTSWFGPPGLLLAVAGVVAAVGQMRRRAAPALAVLLASMPIAFIGVLAAAIAWDPWRGRFFIFPFALAAATWGLVLRYRALTLTVMGLAVTTLVLVLANADSRPSGLHFLSGNSAQGIWGKPRWWTQSVLRLDENQRQVLRFAEKSIPAGASVAIAPRENEFLSPYFGPGLTRHVELVLNGAAVTGRSDWLMAAPGVRPRMCDGEWLTRLQTERGWLIAQRTSASGECTGS